jgi:hypothetical protein
MKTRAENRENAPRDSEDCESGLHIPKNIPSGPETKQIRHAPNCIWAFLSFATGFSRKDSVSYFHKLLWISTPV